MLDAWIEAQTTAGTRRTYASVMKAFFKVIYGNVEDINALAENYLSADRKHRADVLKFLAARAHLAPKTIRMNISIVRNFIEDHDIELPAKFWKKIGRRAKGGPITKEDIPTSEELRRIMAHLKARGRAVYLFLAASGCRIGETLQIRFKDLDMEADPPRARLRAETTKTREARTVFFTAEAKEAMEEWLKVRRVWMKYRESRFFAHGSLPDEELVFPFSDDVIREDWRKALRASGLMKQDERTRYASRRPHTLRKRFRTQLGAVIPADVVEELIGHGTSVYRRFTQAELAEFYKEGEHVLYLSTEQVTLKRLERQMKERGERIERLEEELRSLKGEALLDEALED